jgi:hypothetical protein
MMRMVSNGNLEIGHSSLGVDKADSGQARTISNIQLPMMNDEVWFCAEGGNPNSPLRHSKFVIGRWIFLAHGISNDE